MLDLFGIEMRHSRDIVTLGSEDWAVLVDAQKGNSNDSLLGSAGDLVITIAGVNVVVAYSIREGDIRFSIRSINSEIKANLLVRRILRDVGFGGGHEAMAGGFLPSKNIPADRKIDTFIRYRAISFVNGI